jgi:hypothetical protein
MYNFKTIPPPQKYMSLELIDKLFGARGVVAYGCKLIDGVPRGGYVVAVQDQQGDDSAQIKKYLHQFKARFPGKEPVYYIRLEPGETDRQWAITYDSGSKESKALPEISEKKSKAEESIEKVPLDLIAKAIRTGISLDNI